MPKTHDIPKEVASIAQAAKIWGIPKEEVSRARVKGGIDAFRNGRIQREPLVKWLAENPPNEEDAEALDWKTRKLKGQALQVEMTVAKARGELIEKKTVERTWAKYFAIITEVFERHLDRIAYNAAIKEIKSKLPTELEYDQ